MASTQLNFYNSFSNDENIVHKKAEEVVTRLGQYRDSAYVLKPS